MWLMRERKLSYNIIRTTYTQIRSSHTKYTYVQPTYSALPTSLRLRNSDRKLSTFERIDKRRASVFCVGRARSNHLRSPITAQDVGGGRRCLASASRIRVSRIAARHGLTYIQRLITDATGVVDTINPPERLVDGGIRNCIPLKYILCHFLFLCSKLTYVYGWYTYMYLYLFEMCQVRRYFHEKFSFIQRFNFF